MTRLLRSFWKDEDGATAATVALTLFALLGAGGIAFDYARLAALDTELQAAADQAALAAAGQLDGQSSAVSRATSAAQNLVRNHTAFANDGATSAITVPTVVFYTDYSQASGPSGTTTSDALANYVRVTVGARTANYVLTPIVGAISSEPLTASAVAGLSSAICNNPPVMMCNPQEPLGNTDESYPFSVPPGAGIRLQVGSADAPGNFGFLESGFGSGASDLARALGYNSPPGSCVPVDGLTTKPGMSASVMAALNTRFDISENGSQTCPSGGTCSPSANVRKDIVRSNSNGASCDSTGNNGWSFIDDPAVTYMPSTNAPITTTPEVMGHPRDICHAFSLTGACTDGRVGDGVWDRNAYFRTNYNWTPSQWTTNTGLGSSATRYQVYLWELQNQSYLATRQLTGSNSSRSSHAAPICRAPGITPIPNVADRRRFSVAIVNCNANRVAGRSSGLDGEAYDIFFVEPSFNRGPNNNRRTTDSDVYVEVIGPTSPGSSGSSGSQFIRRDVPTLLE
jgi:Flp pilus assembly protein TadG